MSAQRCGRRLPCLLPLVLATPSYSLGQELCVAPTPWKVLPARGVAWPVRVGGHAGGLSGVQRRRGRAEETQKGRGVSGSAWLCRIAARLWFVKAQRSCPRRSGDAWSLLRGHQGMIPGFRILIWGRDWVGLVVSEASSSLGVLWFLSGRSQAWRAGGRSPLLWKRERSSECSRRLK